MEDDGVKKSCSEKKPLLAQVCNLLLKIRKKGDGIFLKQVENLPQSPTQVTHSLNLREQGRK
jgi:hypothetical protein